MVRLAYASCLWQQHLCPDLKKDEEGARGPMGLGRKVRCAFPKHFLLLKAITWANETRLLVVLPHPSHNFSCERFNTYLS